MRQNATQTVERVPFLVRRACTALAIAVIWCTGGSAQDADSDKLRMELVARLRQECLTRPKLKGVRIDACELSEDEQTLELRGLVDGEAQREEIVSQTQTIVKSMAPFASLSGKTVSGKMLKEFSIRTVYLSRIQSSLATRDYQDATLKSMFHQTRLDDVVFDDRGGLLFRATCLDSVARDRQENPDDAPDTPENQLLMQLEFVLEHELTPTRFEELNLVGNRVEIRFLGSPVPVLQAAIAAKTELDGVLLESAAYDADGQLTFTGIVSDDEQRAKLADMLPQLADRVPSWDERQDPQAALRELHAYSLEVYAKKMQASLAVEENPMAHRSRVVRTFLNAQGELAIQLQTLGVRPDDPESLAAEQQRFEALVTQLHQQVKAQLPPFAAHLRVAAEPVVFVEPPIKDIQAEVVRETALDGISIDDAQFDQRGNLQLGGLWRNPEDDQKRLEPVVTRALQKIDSPLADATISWTSMSVLPVDDLLVDMRKWTSENLQEVWLERVHFDEQQRLRIEGSSVKTGQDANCEKHLAEMIRIHPLGRYLQKRNPNQPIAATVTVELAIEPTSVTDELRKRIADRRDLDGVSIERGYYGPDGSYHVSGLVDHAKQKASVKTVVAEFAKDAKIASRVPGGIILDEFDEIPLAGMLEKINGLLPAIPIFDGIVVEAAYHDAENRLTFRGQIVGDLKPQAETQMVELINQNEQWKRRARDGVSFEKLTAIEQNRAIANRSVQGAVAALQKLAFVQMIAGKDVDTVDQLLISLRIGVLHNPQDATAWFLRGMCHLMKGEDEYARRDFCRAALAGKIDRNALSRLQGKWRIAAEETLDEVKDVVDANGPEQFQKLPRD